MEIFDIAVIGAGPAGCMAAIKGAREGKRVILLERNDKIGRKLLLTANGRCNITNAAILDVFLEKFGKNGLFYRDAFKEFSNHDLMAFFRSYGLEFKEEEEGRIFPVTDKSRSVVEVLKKALKNYHVEIFYNYRVIHLTKLSKIYKLTSTEKKVINAHSIILATGGSSYQVTGSTGDGFNIAKTLRHHITQLKPGGVPLTVRENWLPKLKGITLEDVGLKLQSGGKVKSLSRGNLLITHFGVSGPVILDMSHTIIEIMEKHGDLKLYIDLKPDISHQDLESSFIEDFRKYNKRSLKNYIKNYMPQNMVETVLSTVQLDPDKKLNQITKKERLQLQRIIKTLPITLNGHLPLNKAMVTCGGISKKDINPKTMESKLVPGLYFAGEIIDGCGRRGGYNLQQAFSTGYLAGSNASRQD
jgi:predicted Rossmann fold flavoprotein